MGTRELRLSSVQNNLSHRSLDATQLTMPVRLGPQLCVDPTCQRAYIAISRADENAGVFRAAGMEADKMPAVVRNNDPILPDRSRQDDLVRSPLTRDSTFGGCPDIMAQFVARPAQHPAGNSRLRKARPWVTPSRCRRFVARSPRGAAARRPRHWPGLPRAGSGNCATNSASLIPSRCNWTRSQTGIRVRMIQGSPPQTAGLLSIPGARIPRSRTTRWSTSVFSPAVMWSSSRSTS